MTGQFPIKRRLQVFVSSTYTDLKVERQAAVSAILKAGHIPAGMELFTAGDKSQLETIYRWIDESDVYMLVLGGRYGSIESETGIAYTELEFDYAIQQKKPVFSVVITEGGLDNKVSELGKSCIEGDNGTALKQFREKVLSKMSSFFTDEKDVRLAVYESMSDFSTRSELKGWVPADSLAEVAILKEEIQRLRSERDERSAKETKAGGGKVASPQRDEISGVIEILKNTYVKIPVAAGGTGNDVDLLGVFYGSKDALVCGVTNQYGANESEAVLYFNVVPKLQVHGLADTEKVAGVRYRRAFLTKKGFDVLAELDRRRVESKTANASVEKPSLKK